MRNALRACCAAVAAAIFCTAVPARSSLIAAPPGQAVQQGGVFRSGAKMVPIYATVTDTKGELVPDLTREDFEILDNNVRQDLIVFENQTQPVTAVVMIDSSGSMTNSLKLVKAGAEQFVIRLLPQDKAQVGAFNDPEGGSPLMNRLTRNGYPVQSSTKVVSGRKYYTVLVGPYPDEGAVQAAEWKLRQEEHISPIRIRN